MKTTAITVLMALLMAVTVRADYYNQTTSNTAARLPTQLSTDTGVIVRPTEADYSAAGWLMADIIDEPTPDGMVQHQLTGITVIDGVPTRNYTYMTQADYDQMIAEEQAAADAIEQARIGALAAQYGARVQTLQTTLQQFGLSIPTTYQDVLAAIEAKIAAGQLTNEQLVLIGTLDVVYKAAAEVMSDEEIEAVFNLLNP